MTRDSSSFTGQPSVLQLRQAWCGCRQQGQGRPGWQAQHLQERGWRHCIYQGRHSRLCVPPPFNPGPLCLQIKFDTTIKDLKQRKCNAVFGSRAYKDHKKKFDRKNSECQQLKGGTPPIHLSFLLLNYVRLVTPNALSRLLCAVGAAKEAKKALRGAICAAKVTNAYVRFINLTIWYAQFS